MGRYGEKVAKDFLTNKGYKIVAKNYIAAHCEIDLIAKYTQPYGDVIVFVEVKARTKNTFNALPCEFVRKKKQQRIIYAAKCYCHQNKIKEHCRFDIIEIYFDLKKIRHLKNAFE